MIRHDSSEQKDEQDGPGTPGLRALAAMAAAARRAREEQEGGPQTQAVEIQFDDETVGSPPPPSPATSPQSERPPSKRSPLEVAVWLAAALVLVAAGALAVTLGTDNSSGGPSALPSKSISPASRSATHPSSRSRGSGVVTAPATSSTTTTTVAVSPSGPPVIAALNPSSGASGQAIQVAGANFLSSSGQIIATFNGQVAPTSCPAQNACSVTVPPPPSGSQTAQVVITTPTGTSNTMTFTYT